MAPLSRRDFLAAAGAIAGTGLGIPGNKNALAQSIPSLHKFRFIIPQDILDQTLSEHDDRIADLQAMRGLVDTLVAPADSTTMLNILDQSIKAAEASKENMISYVDTVASKGFPRKSNKFLNAANHSGKLVETPFRNEVKDWAENNPDALAEVAEELFEDPEFESLLMRACGSTEYGVPVECSTSGEVLLVTTDFLGLTLIEILIILAIALIIAALWLARTLDRNAREVDPCTLGKDLADNTVDNSGIKPKPENYQAIVNRLISIMNNKGKQFDSSVKNKVAGWIDDEAAKFPNNKPRQEKFKVLSDAVRQSPC